MNPMTEHQNGREYNPGVINAASSSIKAKTEGEQEIRDFLDLLYGKNGDEGYLVLFTVEGSRSYFFNRQQLSEAASKASLLSETQDVYFGAGLQKEKLEGERGKAETVTAIPGLWLDVDIRGPNHASEELPPDIEAARTILDSCPLKPSLVLSTGGGLHVYWLFREPLGIKNEADMARTKTLSKQFQGVFLAAASSNGWKIDNTSSLAQVLRLPGTFNYKQGVPVPVEVIECNRDNRYNPAEIEGWLENASPIFGGHRNRSLFTMGSGLRGNGMEYEAILQELTNVNKTKCKPPLPEEDVVTIARSASGYEPNNNGNRRVPTQAQRIVSLFDGIELFHTANGESFVEILVNGHRETWPLNSKPVREYISRSFFERHNTAPGSQSLQDALAVVDGRAQYGSPKKDVYIRLAKQDDLVFLDLCNDDWEIVKITSEGWEISKDYPIRFRRSSSMKSLPRPVVGGKIEELKKLINVDRWNQWVLIVSWLVGALNPNGPYPILILQGEQGSAKSTTARILRALVDPSSAPIRALARSERDLMVSANNGWVLAFDNLSGIHPWMSDALCRISTGGGFSVRKNYTDTDEVIFEAMRPVILNGIDQISNRHDLADRSLVVNLPRIPESKRKLEKDLWSSFDSAQPRILGGLLTAVSASLKNYPNVQLGSYPRMADFAKWIIAAEPKLPWPKGSFLKYYNENRDESALSSLESDSVAVVLRHFIELRRSWNGTATQLKKDLESHAKEHMSDQGFIYGEYWPKTPNGLINRLNRIADALRKAGTGIDSKTVRGVKMWEIKLQGGDPTK